jgi:hypothetical protein
VRVDRRGVIAVLCAAIAAALWFSGRSGREVESPTPATSEGPDVPPPALAASGREARSAAATGPRVPRGGTASGDRRARTPAVNRRSRT